MAPTRKQFGELVLRSANAPALVSFYRNVIGLEQYAAIGSATFLKIDEASDGHPQLLAIFDKSHSFSGPKDMQSDNADARAGTMHHFAFLIDHKDFHSEQNRLESAGVEVPSKRTRSVWMAFHLHA